MAVETYELTVSGTLAGQFVQTIMAINVNNTGSSNPFVMANDLLEEFNTASGFFELWCDCLPTAYDITSARCRRILATGGPTQIFLAANLIATTGTRTGGISTSGVSPLFIWLTTTRPTKTGRTFLPGVSESDIDSMVLSGGVLGAMNAFGQYFRDGGTIGGGSDTWTGSIYRRLLAAADDVTNFRVSPVIGNLRRRLRPV